jgi:hypothetical protein
MSKYSHLMRRSQACHALSEQHGCEQSDGN